MNISRRYKVRVTLQYWKSEFQILIEICHGEKKCTEVETTRLHIMHQINRFINNVINLRLAGFHDREGREIVRALCLQYDSSATSTTNAYIMIQLFSAVHQPCRSPACVICHRLEAKITLLKYSTNKYNFCKTLTMILLHIRICSHHCLRLSWHFCLFSLFLTLFSGLLLYSF